MANNRKIGDLQLSDPLSDFVMTEDLSGYPTREQVDSAIEDVLQQISSYGLVDKEPVNSDVTLDNRTVNVVNVKKNWAIESAYPDGAFVPEGALSYPVWNSNSGSWESYGNDEYVMHWYCDEGEASTYLYTDGWDYVNSTINFGKPASQLQGGDTVSVTVVVDGNTVNFTSQVSYMGHDEYEDTYYVELEGSVITLPTGQKWQWYAGSLQGIAPDAAQTSLEWEMSYYYTMMKGDQQNISSFSFPTQIAGKSRDFLVKVVLENGTTMPTFPANVDYEVAVPQVASGTTAVLQVTETSPNKFYVRDWTPMTTAQTNAINSGITAAKVTYYDNTLSGLEDLIESI